MKRLISIIFLVLVLAVSAICVSADDTVYTGDELEVVERLWPVSASITHEEDADGTTYSRITAKAGQYANGALRIHFCPRDISLGDYPFVKVIYRTNADKGVLDVTNRTGRGEGWLMKHPDMTNDETWQSVVINMNDITGGKGPANQGEMGAQLVLKPFGTQTALLLTDAYFDIHSVACFKTLEEAEAYTAGFEYVKVEKVLEKSVYGMNRFENEYIVTVSEAGMTLEKEDDYYHVTSKPGSYNNDQLKMEFLFPDISLTELRFVKFGYRTDTTSTRIDTTIRSTKNESWPGGGVNHPAPVSDGKWHEIIVDINTFVGGGGVPPVGERGIKLVLKPFGAGNVNLSRNVYFDLKYVACFPTLEEAEAYVYSEADDVAPVGSYAEGIELKVADKALVEKYMTEFENRIDAIINTETDVEVKGTKYYVAANGNDKNDGKSPETAWQTIDRVNYAVFKEGDGVFFKRGDTFRITESINAQNGVTYSAYGYGHKPLIICSIDGSGADKWIATDAPNVYKYADKISGDNSVGNIIFDDGKCWGVMVQKTKDGYRQDIGKCFNGLEFITVSSKKFNGYSSLDANLEFYHDWESETLYLYCKDGNPGEVYKTIEIADKGHGFKGTDVKNIVIDNLEIFGTGSHAIGFGGVWDSTVQNCVFRFIGGSVQGMYLFNSNTGVRFGNAVESSQNAVNFTIRNNYASQIYDCCWTVQNSGAYTFENVQMYGNISEYCNTGLEVWMADSGRVTNMQLYDNITRFNGYGFSNQRPNKDGNFFYGANGVPKNMKGNDIYNNINLFASYQAIRAVATGEKQFNFHDNIYIMEEGKLIGGISATPEDGNGQPQTIKYDEIGIKRTTARGWEKGSDFYTADAPFENMYASYVPYVRGRMFKDVASKFWGKGAVDFVTSKGYFMGVTDTTFAPDGTMTRAMLVTVLSRIAGETGVGTSTYTDVNKNAWYISGVAWAEENGIVKAGGAFRPDEMATREEMADMFYRFALKMGIEAEAKETNLTDIDKVSPEYADGVKFCTSSGIITGYDDGTVKPQNNVTRAQAATMIQRYVNLIG